MSRNYQQQYIKNPHIFNLNNSLPLKSYQPIVYTQNYIRPSNNHHHINNNNNNYNNNLNKSIQYSNSNVPVYNSNFQPESYQQPSFAYKIKQNILSYDKQQQLKKQQQKQKYRKQLENQIKADKQRKKRQKQKQQQYQLKRQQKFYQEVKIKAKQNEKQLKGKEKQKQQKKDKNFKQEHSYFVVRSSQQKRYGKNTKNSRIDDEKMQQKSRIQENTIPKIMKRGGYHNQSALDSFNTNNNNNNNNTNNNNTINTYNTTINNEQFKQHFPTPQSHPPSVNPSRINILTKINPLINEQHLQMLRQKSYQQQRISNIIRLQQLTIKKLQSFKKQIIKTKTELNVQQQVEKIKFKLRSNTIKLTNRNYDEDNQDSLFNNQKDLFMLPDIINKKKNKDKYINNNRLISNNQKYNQRKIYSRQGLNLNSRLEQNIEINMQHEDQQQKQNYTHFDIQLKQQQRKSQQINNLQQQSSINNNNLANSQISNLSVRKRYRNKNENINNYQDDKNYIQQQQQQPYDSSHLPIVNQTQNPQQTQSFHQQS